jgi:hypothetical protein
MDPKNLKRIRELEREIHKWRSEISKLDLLPCRGDRDLREKELSINSLEKLIGELEKEKNRLSIKAMHPHAISREKVFQENEQVSEDVIWIGTKKRDNRNKDRHLFEKVGDVSAEFLFEKRSKKYRVCNASVVDSSKNGFAVLIPQSGRRLTELLGIGDKIYNITFFGLKAQVKRDGIVKHITRVREGRHKDCHVMGIEALDWSMDDQGKTG